MFSDWDDQVVCIFGARCIFCSPTASAGGPAELTQWAGDSPQALSKLICSQQTAKHAGLRLTEETSANNSVIARAHPELGVCPLQTLGFLRLFIWSCMWNVPRASLMSDWDRNVQSHMHHRWYPNSCNYPINNKTFLQDMALCCIPWTSIANVTAWNFLLLEVLLGLSGKAVKNWVFF